MCYTLHTHREEMRGGNKVGYAVVHMMKIKSGAVGGIQSHNNREHEPKTNPDVDMSRSEDNYDLTMQDRKDTLQGEIERLEEVKNRANQTMKRVHETVNQQKPILLDLQKRISEAKSELSVVETAVKEKKAEGAEKFGWDGMAERIERARKEAGKDNHIKALEARISLLERFISLSQVKPLWEQFQALIGRKKPQKDHER